MGRSPLGQSPSFLSNDCLAYFRLLAVHVSHSNGMRVHKTEICLLHLVQWVACLCRSWDKCMGSPGNSLSYRESACFENCAKRFLETTQVRLPPPHPCSVRNLPSQIRQALHSVCPVLHNICMVHQGHVDMAYALAKFGFIRAACGGCAVHHSAVPAESVGAWQQWLLMACLPVRLTTCARVVPRHLC